MCKCSPMKIDDNFNKKHVVWVLPLFIVSLQSFDWVSVMTNPIRVLWSQNLFIYYHSESLQLYVLQF